MTTCRTAAHLLAHPDPSAEASAVDPAQALSALAAAGPTAGGGDHTAVWVAAGGAAPQRAEDAVRVLLRARRTGDPAAALAGCGGVRRGDYVAPSGGRWRWWRGLEATIVDRLGAAARLEPLVGAAVAAFDLHRLAASGAATPLAAVAVAEALTTAAGWPCPPPAVLLAAHKDARAAAETTVAAVACDAGLAGGGWRLACADRRALAALMVAGDLSVAFGRQSRRAFPPALRAAWRHTYGTRLDVDGVADWLAGQTVGSSHHAQAGAVEALAGHARSVEVACLAAACGGTVGEAFAALTALGDEAGTAEDRMDHAATIAAVACLAGGDDPERAGRRAGGAAGRYADGGPLPADIAGLEVPVPLYDA